MILVLTTSYGGECVGRNRKNITIQLNKRIDALLRIGEKKVNPECESVQDFYFLRICLQMLFTSSLFTNSACTDFLEGNSKE